MKLAVGFHAVFMAAVLVYLTPTQAHEHIQYHCSWNGAHWVDIGDYPNGYDGFPENSAISDCRKACLEKQPYTFFGLRRNGEFSTYARCFCSDASSNSGEDCYFECQSSPCGGDNSVISAYLTYTQYQCSTQNDYWTEIDGYPNDQNGFYHGTAIKQCRQACHNTSTVYGVRRNGPHANLASCFCAHKSATAGQCPFICGVEACGGDEQGGVFVSAYIANSEYRCTTNSWPEEVSGYPGGNNGFTHTTAIPDCREACLNEYQSTLFGVSKNGIYATYAKCFCANTIADSENTCKHLCGGEPCGGDNGLVSAYTVCPSGTYGITDCSAPCPGFCEDNICDLVSGICHDDCVDGWYGSSCENTCPSPNCLSPKCNKTSGDCVDGCVPGWYTPTCQTPCSPNCASTTCDFVDGACDGGCDPGWYQPTCTMQCSPNCVETTCNITNGTCDVGCTDGWYGALCNYSCPANCAGGCDRNSGDCSSCKDGLYGPRCDLQCPYNCNQTVCDFVSGSCTYECIPGFYGATCDIPCSEGCLTNTCNFYNGSCDGGCDPGWYTPTCQTPCPPSCKQCDINTGECVGDCVDGYYGVHCNITCSGNCVTCARYSGECRSCVPGFYGSRCIIQCPSNCNQTICDFETGVCTYKCIPGYYGALCDFPCSQSCLNNICDFITGKCTDGCACGYYGTDCAVCSMNCASATMHAMNKPSVLECSDGFYGDTCTTPCSEACLLGTCNSVSGRCQDGCVTGYYGSMCEKICPANCQNNICSMTDGLCTDGCLTGWTGGGCNQQDEVYIATPMWVWPVVVMMTLVGILLGVIVACFFLSRDSNHRWHTANAAYNNDAMDIVEEKQNETNCKY